MHHTAYYLIEPNVDAFRQFSARIDSEYSGLVLEPWLTSRQYADLSAWHMVDLELAVKLLYLARLREYEFLSEDAKAIHALGSAAISEAVFDRWWTVRRLHLNEGSSEQMEAILGKMLEKVPATGNELVDEWLQTLKSTEPEPSA
jgi:hypothetical protein